MTDPDSAPGKDRASEPAPDDSMPPRIERPPFPWMRLLFALGACAIAWVMFWLIVVLLAPLYYITLAITGKPNEELKDMSSRAVHYLMELLGYTAGVSDERPFPFGPFRKA